MYECCERKNCCSDNNGESCTPALESYAKRTHETAITKGFWDEEVTPTFILAKIALLQSECSELLEAVRKQKGEQEIMHEFADIIIRTVDLYEGMKGTEHLSVEANLTEAVEEKMRINEHRPHKHGNLA